MPSVSESEVKYQIQHVVNSTRVLQDQMDAQIVFAKVNDFANYKLTQVLCGAGLMLCFYGIFNNIVLVMQKSKHDFIHCIEGLLPLIICTVYVQAGFSFTEIGWNEPIYIFAPMSCFFSLSCSRMIIATVTK